MRRADAGRCDRPLLLPCVRPLGKRIMSRAADFQRIQHAAQGRRRAEISRWLERMDQLRSVTPRTADEAEAQRLAIARHIATVPA